MALLYDYTCIYVLQSTVYTNLMINPPIVPVKVPGVNGLDNKFRFLEFVLNLIQCWCYNIVTGWLHQCVQHVIGYIAVLTHSKRLWISVLVFHFLRNENLTNKKYLTKDIENLIWDISILEYLLFFVWTESIRFPLRFKYSLMSK